MNFERKEVIKLYASHEDAEFHHCVRIGWTNDVGLHDTPANILTLISGNWLMILIKLKGNTPFYLLILIE